LKKRIFSTHGRGVLKRSDVDAHAEQMSRACKTRSKPRLNMLGFTTTRKTFMQIRDALPLLAGACLMPALAVGQASPTNVQLYGQATAGVTAKSHQAGGDSSVELGNSVLASSFIGLRGTEDLGGGMSALFRLESAVNIGNGVGGVSVAKEQKFWNRHAFVGLNLSPGIAITAGRQYLPHADRVLQTLDVYNIGGTSLHTTPLGLFGVNRFVGNDNRTDSSLKLRWRGASGWTAAAGVGLNDGAGRSASVDVAHVAPSHAVGAYAAKYESPTVVAATGERPEHRVVGLGGQMAFGPARVFLHVASAELDSTQAGGRVQKTSSLRRPWPGAQRPR
jgi:predicted porin